MYRGSRVAFSGEDCVLRRVGYSQSWTFVIVLGRVAALVNSLYDGLRRAGGGDAQSSATATSRPLGSQLLAITYYCTILN